MSTSGQQGKVGVMVFLGKCVPWREQSEVLRQCVRSTPALYASLQWFPDSSSINKWILIKILSTGGLADILCVCDKSLLFSAEISSGFSSLWHNVFL